MLKVEVSGGAESRTTAKSRLRRPDSCLGWSERGLGLGGRMEGGPRTEPWGTPELCGKGWKLWELRCDEQSATRTDEWN